MPAWPRQTNQEGKEFIDMHEVLLIRSENEPNVEGSGMARLVEWNEGSLHKHTSFKKEKECKKCSLSPTSPSRFSHLPHPSFRTMINESRGFQQHWRATEPCVQWPINKT